jgi:hypothetical protein
MRGTPETDKLWDAQTISDTPYHEAWEEMADHASELERQRDEAKENLKITQDAWIQAKAERAEATRVRDEAVDNYETAVLREHRMQEQRDELVEAVREAWFAMDEIEGTDKMLVWQNKYSKYV